MACVMRPRGAFVGSDAALLDDLVAACQVQAPLYSTKDVELRAQNLVPYFPAQVQDVVGPSQTRNAGKRRVKPDAAGKSAAAPKPKRILRASAPSPAEEGPTAGPGFFSPPTPEQLPLPKLLVLRGRK